MKQLIHILTVIILLFSFLDANAQTGYESEDDLKKKAQEFWEEKDFPGALPLYSQLLSLYPKDPEYNYKFGTSMLHVEEDKNAALRYLEYAASRPNVDPEALFYLGKGYHLNYRFADALKKYNSFKEKGSSKALDALQVDLHISMCNNGLGLLSNITDLAVLDKRTLNKSDFFRSYDVSSFGGKIITKPEDFDLAADKKAKETSIMYLDRNADRLYYSSYGDKGKSGKDIYYSKKLPDGTWGEPQSIGSTINTPYNEDYPFYNPNTSTLYFSSNGHNSMGGYDVFKSVYNPTTDSWGKPQNLDYAVNTPDNDFLYITNASEKTAYFATTRSSVSGEVTVYKVNVERVPVDFTILKGNFFSEATKAAKITVENITSGEIIGIWNSNGNNGDYLMTLPNGGSYKFTVETEESPVAYTGNVELPKQKVARPLKQEIALVVENGYEKLIIKNLFDEDVVSDESLLTADFLKNRANLEINAQEVDEEEEVVEEESIEESVDDGKEFSNEELVKMAYADAEEIQEQAKQASSQTEIAFAIANQKNNEATEKSKEADQLSSDAKTIEDERERLNGLKEANDLRNESNELAKEAVIAYNLGNKLNNRAESLTAQSDQALEVALQLDNAINSNSQTEIDAAYAKIQELLTQETADEDILSDATSEYDAKRTASDKQIQKAIKLKEEADEVEKEVAELRGRAGNVKNKDEKAELELMAEEAEQDLIELREKEKKAMADAKAMQAETDVLKEDAELMAIVVGEIKTADQESVGALSSEEKAALQNQILSTESTLATSEALAESEEEVIAELKEVVQADNYAMRTPENVDSNVANNDQEEVTETSSLDLADNQETAEEDGATDANKDQTQVSDNEFQEESQELREQLETDNNGSETTDEIRSEIDDNQLSSEEPEVEKASGTGQPYSYIETSAIPQENFDNYFEEKETEFSNIINPQEKAAAELELYQAWSDKTKEAIAEKQILIDNESDDVTKQLYQMELEELQHHKENQLAKVAEAQSSLQEENRDISQQNQRFIQEDEIPSDNYDFYFEEKLAEAEQYENPLQKEQAKAEVYENWIDKMNSELFAQKDELIAADKKQKKEIEARIKVLETELESKKEDKAVSDGQVSKLKAEQPELAEQLVNQNTE
ncbi:hypothetical protein N9R81_03315, partial [Flavobacteriales bacterium]|nr:hypothetical protein [Flavobacteriales bacterium]